MFSDLAAFSHGVEGSLEKSRNDKKMDIKSKGEESKLTARLVTTHLVSGSNCLYA